MEFEERDDRPGVWDPVPDGDEVWSNTVIGTSGRLTWKELAAHHEEQLRRVAQFEVLIADLDRCEHGRHEGDVCSSCGGPSVGNKLLVEGAVIGHSLDARPIIMPARRDRHDPKAWKPTDPAWPSPAG